MVLSKTILILEDDLRVLSSLLNKLSELEHAQPYDFSIIVLTNHQQVEDYVNSNPRAKFDIILIDRDCKLNGSFHVLDIERFGVEKVIAISSIQEYNEQLKQRGVTRVVYKDLQKVDEFATKVTIEVARLLRDQKLQV